MRNLALSFAALILLATPLLASDQPAITYPATRTVPHVDTYHAAKVADPYRWLEDDVRVSKEVADWVAAQNEVTFRYHETIPQREAIRRQLTRLWNYEKFTTPEKEGGRYLFKKNTGLQNQDVLYVQSSLTEAPRVLLDPNTFSKDGTVALVGTSVSRDGKYIAYGTSEAGSDWQIWRVMEIDSGTMLPDELRWIKFSTPRWTPDNKGFFYGRYPEPASGEAYQKLAQNNALYYHRLGTAQSDDVHVLSLHDQPDWDFSPQVTEDGRWLVVTVSVTTHPVYQVWYRDLSDPFSGFIELVRDFVNEYSFLGNDGSVFYFKTDDGAPRGRVVAIDVKNAARENWKQIVPEGKGTMTDASLVGGSFLVEYLEDAKSAVRIVSRDGSVIRSVELPGIGIASGFEGKAEDTETFFTFQNMTTPPTVYRFDVATGERRELFRARVAFDSKQFETKQVFYASKDGTRVPMFVAHRKGLKLDGENPTLLYGYGGFNVSQTPYFSASRVVFLQMGGVVAVANLRGGGEYGREWHEAGTKLRKQNVFDDFVAAGEWLVANGYTRPAKLAVQGGSNGGLLVGAVVNQRPELFGAALPAVGVMDMLRFHNFTSGKAWVDDYGSSDDPAQFEALLAYSPYHNVKPGTKYPATLVTTGDTDDRVVPGHSFKYAAALQAAQAGLAPVFIRIETRAGHGAGKPLSKRIEETADLWSFLYANLGMKLPRGFGK
ncbi:MAG: prolyl oligopeptidase family serine peptidase [Thermoanaerobaculia bacterium]|nr:prolyl oligopeptidase family serine peptidase [Thermoanaerobaculia bacterium]